MFWIISAILTVIALIFILPSLLRKKDIAVDARREQNIQIAKEMLQDLESRFEKGEMEEEAYQSTRQELELSLFDDVEEAEQVKSYKASQSSSSVFSSVAIAFLVPVIAIGTYMQLGNPVFTTDFSSKQAAKQELQKNVPKKADGTPDIDTMVAGLQKKMEANPDNPKGWFMLGRSYMVLKRYPDAAKSFERAYKLQPKSTEVMLSLADALSMSTNGSIEGRPAELINKVLTIEPNNLTGLWLGGMASRQQRDYVTAIKRWNSVLAQLQNPDEINEVKSLIVEATKQLTPEQKAFLEEEMKMARSTVAVANPIAAPVKTSDKKATGKGITVSVSLSEKMKSQAQPNDLVFVYAKAVTGPPMPLAAARKQVKDLPLKLVLDDSMAMIPTMKLSGFSEVVVGARISKSGQPIAQNGDLFTEKKPVKAGENVALEIDSVVQK